MEKFTSPLEAQIIEYSMSLGFDDLSQKAINQAKRRITDTIGGALGAFEAKPVEIAKAVVPKVNSGRSARIWGSLEKSTPEGAAFANGTMLRYLDINDTHRTIDGSHPSDNLGGVIALAEALSLNGRDTLLALIISYEIQCRFVDSVPFNENGWDQPVPGVIAMAMAAGRMLSLNVSSMRDALALAVTPNLCTYQTRAGELSMWKGAAAANGATNGPVAPTNMVANAPNKPIPTNVMLLGLPTRNLGPNIEHNIKLPSTICSTSIGKFTIRLPPMNAPIIVPNANGGMKRI